MILVGASGLVWLAATAGVALLLATRNPGWPHRRIALLAPLPLPAIGFGLCVYLFADAAITPADRCGTDACAMAMAGAFFIGLWCAIAYVGAIAIAAWALRRRGVR